MAQMTLAASTYDRQHDRSQPLVSNSTILRSWVAKFSRFFGFSQDPLYYFSGGTRAGSKPSLSWRD
jgi:hypothetical protein